MTRPFCVCVPARNEAGRVATLIEALSMQEGVGLVRVALLVNNSDDGTAEVARSAAEHRHGRVLLRMRDMTLAPGEAHAGSARRAAMALGIEWLDTDDGLLISTDADCRPPPGWIAANLAAAAPGTVIGGAILLDEREPVTPEMRAIRTALDAYWQAVRDIEDAIDPLPWDPPPRHGDHTGASLALDVGLYRRAGGVPPLASGEDQALVAAAIGAGGRLVHPPSVWTRTSARDVGRAAGGMAEDMRRWRSLVGSGDAMTVPALSHWRERARWRRAWRIAHGDATLPAAEAALEPMPNDMVLEWKRAA
ncbi:glycosyltransferase [Sphingomonas sp. ST-64]|uniref:Glycosyltransferase n=1 Tax=Sphingomonas plantiphila TaxID=3163295 RepID=A0ABW8YNM8_9SPHN